MVQTGLDRRRGDWQGVVLPIVLVLTGLILVCGDAAGILSLDRIQNYWPVAVIAVGLADLIAEPKQALRVPEEHVGEL